MNFQFSTFEMFKKIFLKSIRFYQIFISPNFGKVCRFYPGCSEYCYLAIKKYGICKGLWQGLRRILKCHPWNSGGVDIP